MPRTLYHTCCVFLGCLLLVTGCESQSQDDVSEVTVSTAAENVIVLADPFSMTALGRERQLRLYLPPDYEDNDTEYPVIYMQDGQNLFDDLTAYSVEWQVDETLNDWFDASGQGFIVVGIDNGHELRMTEYSPWTNPDYGDAEGEAYVDFIVTELKPYIDNNYRTLSGPDDTIIIGSSMGGLISHYAVFNYPEVFGKAGMYSPSYWFSEAVYDFSREQLDKLTPAHRLYILLGDKEGPDMVANVERMQTLIETDPETGPKLQVKIVVDGEHNETLWRSHFAENLAFFNNNADQ